MSIEAIPLHPKTRQEPSVQVPQPEKMPDTIWRRVTQLLTRVLSQRTTIGKNIRQLPMRMEKVSRQCALVLEMIDDVSAGRMQQVPWRAVIIGAVALLYATSPADIVPDAFPIIGSLDDLAVIAVAMRLMRKDLERYCSLKGYALEQYF